MSDNEKDLHRFAREILLDPHYEQKLIERIRNDSLAAEVMDTLLAHARGPAPTEGRAFARKVLSAGWHVDEAVH